jgi:hypothetical protein
LAVLDRLLNFDLYSGTRNMPRYLEMMIPEISIFEDENKVSLIRNSDG